MKVRRNVTVVQEKMGIYCWERQPYGTPSKNFLNFLVLRPISCVREWELGVDGWRYEDADTAFIEKAIGFPEDHKKDNASEDSYNVWPV